MWHKENNCSRNFTEVLIVYTGHMNHSAAIILSHSLSHVILFDVD